MSLFAVLCTIDPMKLSLFGVHRAAHYAFLIAEKNRILFGGPARAVDSGAPEVMIIIVDATNLEEAEMFIASEPYNLAGGFSSVVVRPWSQVLPEPETGSLARAQKTEMSRK